MSQANTSWHPQRTSSIIQRERPLFRNEVMGSQDSVGLQRRSSLQAFIPKLDTTVEALRETSQHVTPRTPGKGESLDQPALTTNANNSRLAGPKGSILNDSRVLNASALRFQEADDFQRSAVSSIVNRIKNRPQRETAGSSRRHESHTGETWKDHSQKEHLENIQDTHNQLKTLEDQLNALSDRANQDVLKEMADKSKQKMKTFEAKSDKIWDDLNAKMKAEGQREALLLKVLDKENKEIEKLEDEIEKLSKDLARTENIKEYLTDRKQALWALKKAHESDKGKLTNQNARISKLHLENRALRRKELERIKTSEEVQIQQSSNITTRKIQKMEKENKKLRHHLEKLTIKQERK